MAAWLAAGLMLLSPLSVVYSQEIRVYALLPVVYQLSYSHHEGEIIAARAQERPCTAVASASAADAGGGLGAMMRTL